MRTVAKGTNHCICEISRVPVKCKEAAGMHLRSLIRAVSFCLLALLLACGEQRPASVSAQVTNSPDPHIGTCPIFSANNVWNRTVQTRPVHTRSADYVNRIGTSKPVHPNFGSTADNGIPITLMTQQTAKVKVS